MGSKAELALKVATVVVWALAVVAAGVMLGWILAGLGLAGCKPTPVPVDPDFTDATWCAPACANLARLSCPGWRGTPGADEVFGTEDDVPCERACADVVEADPSTTLNQRCVADADGCEAVDECFDSE